MAERAGTLRDLIAEGVGSNTTMSVPPGYAIKDIFVRNRTSNAVTGGIKIGTTSGGTEVLGATAVGADAFIQAAPSLRLFSATVAQTLHLQAVTAWNGASLDVVVTMDRAIP